MRPADGGPTAQDVHARGRARRRRAPGLNQPLPQAPRVLQYFPEVAPELDPHEGVENRVEAAVQVGHAAADGHDAELPPLDLTAPLREQPRGVAQQRRVVRQVARHEDRHHGQHHTHGLPPLAAVLRPEQAAQHAAVAERHEGQRQQEAHRHLEAGHQHLHQLTVGAQRASHRHALGPQVVLLLQALRIEERGEGQGDGQHPHRRAGQAAQAQGQGAGAGAEGAPGLDDGHVAVAADARQQEHAGIEVDAVEAPRGLAHAGGHRPAELLVVDGEREGGHEEQVGQGHVEQEEVRHGAAPLVIGVGDDHQEVAQQAEHADEGVDVGLHQGPNGVGVEGANTLVPRPRLLSGPAVIVGVVAGHRVKHRGSL